MSIDLKVPEAGESVTEVEIGSWIRAEGDFVQSGEPLVEIETDKASMEVPAPVSGRIEKILKNTGDSAVVGEVIAQLDSSAIAPASESANGSASAKVADGPSAVSDEPVVMPSARRVLAQGGVDASTVAGTGRGGRITKRDAEDAVRRAPAEQDHASAAPQTTAPIGPRAEEVVPMTMLRRRIGERLVHAQTSTASLTTFNECDMSAVMQTRRERQDDFVKRYGVKVGFMSFFVKAVIDALKVMPRVNAEIRENDVVYKHYYDIGVAVSTEKGLVVPVIRNAELLSFAEIELTIADLATRARDRKLSVDEMQGGTFTISNGGVFGSMMSTPILNPPQSGILGLHAINERPVAINGNVEIRPMMYIALTYDHRIIDGRESVTFLKRVKECIENPVRMLIEV